MIQQLLDVIDVIDAFHRVKGARRAFRRYFRNGPSGVTTVTRRAVDQKHDRTTPPSTRSAAPFVAEERGLHT